MPAHSDSDTGIRFGIGARRRRRARPRRRAAKLAEHAVEQLEHAGVPQQHRLGPPGRARRELDERDVGVVAPVLARLGARRSTAGDVDRIDRRSVDVPSTSTWSRRPAGRPTQHVVDARWPVRRGFSGTYTPPARHTPNSAATRSGAVRQHHGDRRRRADAALGAARAAIVVGRGRAARRASRRSSPAMHERPSSASASPSGAKSRSARLTAVVSTLRLERLPTRRRASRRRRAGPRPGRGGPTSRPARPRRPGRRR